MNREPIAESLFTWPSDDPRLIGNHCNSCGTVGFPARAGCARCGSSDMERHLLGARGTLWTWTSQGFVPKAPFSGNVGVGPEALPWFVGLVELPGELRVECLLVGVTQETLEIGMPMRLVAVPFRVDGDDRQIVTFAFTPDGSDEHGSPEEREMTHA